MEEQTARASRWYRIPASWSGCKLEQIQKGAKESPKSGSIWQVSYATWATCRYAHVEGQTGDASRQTEHQDVDLPVLMISFAGVAWRDASCLRRRRLTHGHGCHEARVPLILTRVGIDLPGLASATAQVASIVRTHILEHPQLGELALLRRETPHGVVREVGEHHDGNERHEHRDCAFD